MKDTLKKKKLLRNKGERKKENSRTKLFQLPRITFFFIEIQDSQIYYLHQMTTKTKGKEKKSFG